MFRLRLVLLSLEAEEVRRRMLSICYPNCIIVVRKSQKTLVWVNESDHGIVIFEERDMQQSCARCRVYDHAEWNFAKNAMNLGVDAKNSVVRRVIRDAFDVEKLKEPILAKLLGKKTLYYAFEWKQVDVLPESSTTLPAFLRKQAAEARQLTIRLPPPE